MATLSFSFLTFPSLLFPVTKHRSSPTTNNGTATTTSTTSTIFILNSYTSHSNVRTNHNKRTPYGNNASVRTRPPSKKRYINEEDSEPVPETSRFGSHPDGGSRGGGGGRGREGGGGGQYQTRESGGRGGQFGDRCTGSSGGQYRTRENGGGRESGQYRGRESGSGGGEKGEVVVGERKRLWKDGEFPGTSVTGTRSGGGGRMPIKNVKKKMEAKENAKGWVSTVTETLAERIQKKQWEEALTVFEMLKEQPFYQPKEGTYMKLLVLLGRAGQPHRARKVFDEMVEEGCSPTPELYTAMLQAYCRNDLLDEAFSVLTEMKNLPLCQPDVYTYSTLLKACVDASRFELVDSLYEEMAVRLITPNTVTQNIVLNGYGKAGKFDQMEKVLTEMLESTECRPDVWTMNTILSLFGNKGQIEMMEKWYEKFRSFGIEPETRSFNILIGAYGKKHMYDKMSSVMEYMRKLQFPWTTSTYNNVIEAFADAGDAKHMEYTFDQMRAEKMNMDSKTFRCLINGYANAGVFHKVVSSIQLAERLEIAENTLYFNAIISACAKAGDLMEMERVFIRMKEKHCSPDSATYSIMVDAYRKEGMSDKIYDLEQEIF